MKAPSDPGVRYSDAGVDTAGQESALRGLISALNPTLDHRQDVGRPLLRSGLFANVLDLGKGAGLAISIDGVGTKALVAQMAGKYDTIGIDCVAMNVNDLLCVGAEPIAMVDYLAVQAPDDEVFAAIGAGLAAGAAQANVSVPGGEVAQIGDMLSGYRGATAFDLVGCAVGTVATDRLVVGQDLREGDVVIGVRSSGVHSNGLSLARRALLEEGELLPDTIVPELGGSVGEELLKPTAIYVKPVLDILRSDVRLKALAHITGDGLMNLTRIESDFGFDLEGLPEPQAIFRLVQDYGKIATAEMYQVFNMGIGFCLVVDPGDIAATMDILRRHGHEALEIGRARPDARRRVRVRLADVTLEGEGAAFVEVGR